MLAVEAQLPGQATLCHPMAKFEPAEEHTGGHEIGSLFVSWVCRTPLLLQLFLHCWCGSAAVCPTCGSLPDTTITRCLLSNLPIIQHPQELVKPASQVLDYRTELTGITAADLQDVQTHRQTVVAKIKALLAPGTVLVGHSLHFDLEALQLDHQPVVDTAMIFSYQ